MNFLDGFDPRIQELRNVKPIGLPFEEFSAFLVREARSRPDDLYRKCLQAPPSEPYPRLERTALYRGDIEDFRRIMDSLMGTDPDGWPASDGTRLQLRNRPETADRYRCQASYSVEVVANEERQLARRCATVKADEGEGMTFVTFRDCHCWQSSVGEAEQLKPIGRPFEELRAAILGETGSSQPAPTEQGADRDEAEQDETLGSASRDEVAQTPIIVEADSPVAHEDADGDYPPGRTGAYVGEQTGTSANGHRVDAGRAARSDDTPMSSTGSREEPSSQFAQGKDADSLYIFRQRGNVWEIAYEGAPFFLEDLKGLAYIHELLRRPGLDLRALDLEAELHGVSPDQPAASLEQDGIEVTPDGEDAQPKIDERTKEACEARLQEIAELLPDAELRREETKVSALKKERDKIEKYLSRSTGLYGKPRSFTDEGERARQRVQKNIKKAIEYIADHSSDLADLLDKHIKTGYECEYKVDPRSEIPWELW
jgi:hypothetical protein